MPDEHEQTNPYAAPDVPIEVVVDESNYPDAEWIHLVTNPRRFFQHLKKFQQQTGPVLLCIWFVGAAGVIDRISTQAGRGQSFEFVMDDWGPFWMAVGLGGILAGAVDWFIGGFFFHIRVAWAGDAQRDKTEARLIYIFTSFLIAVPTILMTALETATFANYRESFQSEEINALFPLYFVVFVAMFYSLYASYKGVTERFAVDPGRARLWFIILPGVLYVIVLAAVFMVALSQLDAG